VKNRQLVFVPEINPNTFLFFFFKGQTGRSYSLREYPPHGKALVRYAKDYPYTADEIIQMAKLKFDAPPHSTNDEKTWQKVIAELNKKYLKTDDYSALIHHEVGSKDDKPDTSSKVVDFHIRSKQGDKILSIKDWFMCLPKRTQAQWIDGRSAKELAKAWFSSGVPKMPEELKKLLKSHSYTSTFKPQYAIAEKVTRLDKFPGGHRNHDLLLVGSAENCKVVLSIEAKADEPFDREINQKGSTNPRTNIFKRIDILTRSLFGQTIKENKELGELRYQLLTGVAGALIEAKKHKADYAVFVVYEFVSEGLDDLKLDLNKNDLNRFVGKLVNQEEFKLQAGQLIEIKSIFGGKYVPADIPILIGKVSTNILTESNTNVERYLPYRMIMRTIYKLWEAEKEYNDDYDLLDVEEDLESEENNRIELLEHELPEKDLKLDLDIDRVDAKIPNEYEKAVDESSIIISDQYSFNILEDREELELIEREPDWLIGLSAEFMKSIKRVDKKIKGRILEAIQLICKNPVALKGDTIKPLSDQYKGLWRYRIGDYRLVYQPDNDNRQVTLLSFAPRSNVYQR